MKTIKFLSIVFMLLIVKSLYGVNYYVDSQNGKDTNNGKSSSSPWKTIDQVNKAMTGFKPGDSILFKRGQNFAGQISVSVSGSDASPIVFGAYGSGDPPIIFGSIPVTGWVQYSGNIYYANVTQTVNEVFIGSPTTITINSEKTITNQYKRMTLARYPNSGWLFTTSGNGNAGFTDNKLTNPAGYWNGCNVHIRSGNWTYETRKVQSYSNTNVVFDTPTDYNTLDQKGYFFDNKFSELDAANEWYYDQSTKRLYFYAPQGKNPSEFDVEASVYGQGVTTSYNITNIIIQDLDFEMHSQSGITLWCSKSIKVLRCNIKNTNIGVNIYCETPWNIVVDNCIIDNCIDKGIATYDPQNSIFSNNIITRTGMAPGLGGSSDACALGIYIGGNSKNNLVSKNYIDSVGYNGIHCMGESNIVEYNIVKNTLLTLNDGGGLYSWGTFSKNNIFRYNFVDYVKGDITSCPLNTPFSFGIYLDDNTSAFKLQNNTISRSTSIGIFLHNSTVNEITGNTVYGTEGLHISYDWDGQDSHQTVKNNVIYNLDENKIPLTIASQLSAMGNESMDNNYYCNPYRNITTAYNGSDGKQYYFGLEQWKQFSGKDPNSKGSLISLTPYIPFDTLGQDLIKNGTFDSNLTDWTYWFLGIDNMSWANDGGMDQGSIKMSLNQSSSAASYGIVFSPNFDLKQNSFYALSSSIKGFNLGTMNIDIQHQVGDANGTVYSSKAALITSKRNMNFVFKTSSLANTQNFVSFLFPRTGSGFYLDNVHLYEVNAKYQEPTSKSVLFSNPSDYTKTFDLQQAIFNDLDGNQITKELTLQPWSSQILILMEGTYQPVVPTTV
ncbi:MAG: right-handed parallel beta-helix repeat-containing protein, partial [Bacteroidota bacterium]|nr:right-handed parallel beta-helix repeat-containing protein [Bacteroidota bacterium]